MAFDPPVGCKEQYHQALSFRAEVRFGRHVEPPVLGRLFRRVAEEHFLRCRALPERRHLEFLRTERVHGDRPPVWLLTVPWRVTRHSSSQAKP
jgi:hypothetical protein